MRCVLSILLYTAKSAGECRKPILKCCTRHVSEGSPLYFGLRTNSNPKLLEWCQLEDMKTTFNKRRWRWVGRILRREPDSIASQPSIEQQRESAREANLKQTWRRTVREEIKAIHQTQGQSKRRPRIERNVENSSLSYAPGGATGSKLKSKFLLSHSINEYRCQYDRSFRERNYIFQSKHVGKIASLVQLAARQSHNQTRFFFYFSIFFQPRCLP